MHIRQAFYTYLIGQAPLTAAFRLAAGESAADRIWNQMAKRDVGYPYIVFKIATTEMIEPLRGGVNAQARGIECKVWGDDPDRNADVSEALIDVINGQLNNKEISGILVLGCTLQDEEDEPDLPPQGDEEPLFTTTQLYRITHVRSQTAT